MISIDCAASKMMNSPIICQYCVANVLYYTIMLAHYLKFGKSHTDMLKKSITALLIGPFNFDTLHKVSDLKDYNPMNYGK